MYFCIIHKKSSDLSGFQFRHEALLYLVLSHRYLDLISFHRKDTAFIIAVSGGAGAAEDFEAVGLEAGRQRIHLLRLPMLNAMCAYPVQAVGFGSSDIPGLFISSRRAPSAKVPKVGAEVRPRVVVARHSARRQNERAKESCATSRSLTYRAMCSIFIAYSILRFAR